MASKVLFHDPFQPAVLLDLELLLLTILQKMTYMGAQQSTQNAHGKHCSGHQRHCPAHTDI